MYICGHSIAAPADSPKNNSVLVVAIILSILGVVLVAMLLVFLKRRSHSEWKPMKIPVTWDITLFQFLKL
jgi:capsular polysaccharide biosynthesis protein